MTETFSALSFSVIRNFIRSALIIDDRWPENGNSALESAIAKEDLLSDATTDDDSYITEPELPSEAASPNASEDADAALLESLHRCLLREGILACGLRYQQKDRNVAISLARRADILILDWHLIDDDGAEALEILKNLQSNGLRFICIWTGQGRAEQVRESLIQALGQTTTEGSGIADLRIGNLVIAIRIKEGLEEEAGLTVGPEGFLDVAIRGLTNNFGGLVQLAVLEMTNQHREHLPGILEDIGDSLDAAVLLEAGDDNSPVAPGGAFLSILVDEWRSRLEQNIASLKVLSKTGRQAFCLQFPSDDIDAWQQRMQKELVELGYSQSVASGCTPPIMARFEQWLHSGCEGAPPQITGADLKKGGWAAIQAALEEGSGLDPLFDLDALFHQQLNTTNSLTQGTVVKIMRGESVHYLVCTTPTCDAERPEKIGGLFTFVRSKIVSKTEFLKGADADFYCVIKEENRWVCLVLLIKERVSFKIGTPRFSDSGIVEARLSFGGNEPPAQDGNDMVELYRVAQLRSEHALSLTAGAASDASRIGVNRVEIIRKGFSKKRDR